MCLIKSAFFGEKNLDVIKMHGTTIKKARIVWDEDKMKTVSDLFLRNLVTLIFPDSPRPKLSASSCNRLHFNLSPDDTATPATVLFCGSV